MLRGWPVVTEKSIHGLSKGYETVGLQMPVGVRLGFLYDINLSSRHGNWPSTGQELPLQKPT
jgi:hypothetical protein